MSNPILIDASPAAFEDLKFLPKSNFAIVDAHLFGESGRWGCICAASYDDVAIIGGDPTFIALFLTGVGGLAALRSQFQHFAETEWSIGDQVRARLLAMAGW